MPTNRLVYPDVNPVQMVPLGVPQYNQYNSDWFANRVRNYEQPTQYFQKWPAGAVVYLQFHSNLAPVQIQLIRCDQSIIATINPTAKAANIYEFGFTTYEASFPVPDEPGTWFIVLSAGFGGSTISFISEPQIILRDKRKLSNLLYFNYWDSSNEADVLFRTTGIRFDFYAEARVGNYIPKSKVTVWEDQPLNLKTVKAIPYMEFQFGLGDSRGCPDWVMMKVNNIFCLTNSVLDGRQYTKSQSEDWQFNSEPYYPMRGWHTTIRLTQNQRSLVGENNYAPAENLVIVDSINTHVFGTFNGDVSNNVIQIIDTN